MAMSLLRRIAPRWLTDDAQQGYLTLLHLAPDAIIVTNEAHRIVFWNKGAEATYGWTRAEALGRKPRELLKSRDHVPRVAGGSVGAALEEHDSWEGEVTHTRKDGLDVRVASRWVVHRDPDGRLLGVVGINRALGEQVIARERVRRVLQLESVRRLAAGMARDLEDRLAVVLSCAEELRRGLSGAGPELVALVEKILAVAAGSREFTRQLVSFAASPEGSARFDMNEVVGRVERVLRRTLPEGVELAVALEPSLWPVICDPTGMARAILSLALHVRDAMASGGRLTLATNNVEVDRFLVSAHPSMEQGPHVRITVAAAESGVAPATEELSEPLSAREPPGRHAVARAHEIVEQNGGSIIAGSEPGRVTRFDLYFPRAGQQGRPADR